MALNEAFNGLIFMIFFFFFLTRGCAHTRQKLQQSCIKRPVWTIWSASSKVVLLKIFFFNNFFYFSKVFILSLAFINSFRSERNAKTFLSLMHTEVFCLMKF